MTSGKLKAVIVGAGSRGNAVFAELMATHDIGFEVAGVVEPDTVRREGFVRRYGVLADRSFATVSAFLAAPRFADLVFICTPDRTHFAICRDVSEEGYAIVLEKPVATTLAECLELREVQRRAGNEIFVAHGLRYSPFFRTIRQIIAEGTIGTIRHIQLTENVGHWHFAHSYVRGQWRRADESAPIVLTKTSHDLDILQWLMGEPVHAVTSFGALGWFRPANAPDGATLRCVDCPHKGDCLYSASRFYLESRPGWPYDVVLDGLPDTPDARRHAIETGPYGKCVWLNDNDVCDSQVVLLEFESGVMASFEMHAHTADNTRKIRILGDRGEITGNLRPGELRVSRFSGLKDVLDVTEVSLNQPEDSHGGGDLHLLVALHEHLASGAHADVMTSLATSLGSHVLAFLAEESRTHGNVKMLLGSVPMPDAFAQPATDLVPEPASPNVVGPA